MTGKYAVAETVKVFVPELVDQVVFVAELLRNSVSELCRVAERLGYIELVDRKISVAETVKVFVSELADQVVFVAELLRNSVSELCRVAERLGYIECGKRTKKSSWPGIHQQTGGRRVQIRILQLRDFLASLNPDCRLQYVNGYLIFGLSKQ